MHRLTGQIGSLGLSWEKNYLGRGVNLGRRGEIFAFGAPNDYSRSSRTSNAPAHYTEEPLLCGMSYVVFYLWILHRMWNCIVQYTALGSIKKALMNCRGMVRGLRDDIISRKNPIILKTPQWIAGLNINTVRHPVDNQIPRRSLPLRIPQGRFWAKPNGLGMTVRQEKYFNNFIVFFGRAFIISAPLEAC